MEKLAINDYYIGELNLRCDMNNTHLEKWEAIYKGAIDINPYYNFEKHKTMEDDERYDSLLTIFYKRKTREYLCLHNNKVYYDEAEASFLDNIVPLDEVLPKIDYTLPKSISYDEALYLFKKLFLFNVLKMNFNFKTYPLEQIYFGELDLCTKIKEINDNPSSVLSLICPNIIEEIMLSLNPSLLSLEGFKNKLVFGSIALDCEYNRYSSVFLQTEPNIYYNINNYKFYKPNEQNLKYNLLQTRKLLEVLKEKNIECPKKMLTIPSMIEIQDEIIQKK